MIELDLQQIQKIELHILEEFNNICSVNGFRYSLGGGTLLGAVRHKGFIPWDDDIDVMMPRPDYDRFIDFCRSNNTSFSLHANEVDSSYQNLFAKLSEPGTLIIDDEINYNSTIGIHIDVFPIDGLGDSYSDAVFHYLKSALPRELLNAKTWSTFSFSKTHNWIYEPARLMLYLLSRPFKSQFLIHQIEMVNSSKSFETSKYAGCVSGSYRFKEIMPIDIFKSYCELVFENDSFSSISNYESYLSKHYGNYMDVPKESTQISHHSFRAFIL